MDKEKLYHLCGISGAITKRKKPKWVPATLRFLGADRYVLGTKNVELAVKHKEQGISLMFKEPVLLNASVLLGKQKVTGLLIDVEVVVGDVVLRLASMNREMYPIVLRKDEQVALI
ncbi:MAG: hypothetical protein JRF27_05275 [Deltaproteobacteria bacterium]|nr:hypothetical protein [Deltaproteobacteria bacterium]